MRNAVCIFAVLRDVFHLDEMSYVLTFLVLFEDVM